MERAVFQLQQRVFEIESTPAAVVESPDTWACTIEAFGNTYTGTGPTKAVAKAKVIENCKAQREGDGFFCKSPKCDK